MKNYGLGTSFSLHHDTRQSNEDVREVFVFVFVFAYVFEFAFVFVFNLNYDTNQSNGDGFELN